MDIVNEEIVTFMQNSVCCTDGFKTALADDAASKRGQLKIMSLISSLVIVLIRTPFAFWEFGGREMFRANFPLPKTLNSKVKEWQVTESVVWFLIDRLFWTVSLMQFWSHSYN